MNAEEIRSHIVLSSQMGIDEAKLIALREIAAQLAELNERLKPGNLEVNIYDCSFADSRRAGEAKS